MGRLSKSKSLVLLIAGTPGTGKSTIAKLLGKKLKAVVVNEKAFCQKEKCATFDKKTKEWEIDLKKYKKAFSAYSKAHARAHPGKPLIIEGHVGCEARLPVSKIVLLACSPTELGYRLAKRHYSELKIQENMFCEATQYCLDQLRQHYAGKPLLKVDTSAHSPAQAAQRIKKWLR